MARSPHSFFGGIERKCLWNRINLPGIPGIWRVLVRENWAHERHVFRDRMTEEDISAEAFLSNNLFFGVRARAAV
jgi:hypothetical protein